MKYWIENYNWIFAPSNRQEHMMLINLCKQVTGKSHGLTSVWYTSGQKCPGEKPVSLKALVVKSRDLAIQIILTFTPACLD